MFGWFRKRRKRVEPEASWAVAAERNEIRITDHKGDIKTVLIADLSGVAIETNDSGPWGADVWWLLFNSDDQLACAFPQGATGEAQVIEYLTKLSGFDHGEMIKAMGSTENSVFAVWRR